MKNKNPTACFNLQSNNKDQAQKSQPFSFLNQLLINKETISIEDRRHRQLRVTHNEISSFRTLMITGKDGIREGKTREGVGTKVQKTTFSLHPQESKRK